MNIINKWLNRARSLFTSQQQQTLEHYKDFFDTIEKHPLTLQQRQAIIADQKRALIIAGAGTGKTSVIVGKIGYLLKSGLCTPDELLIIAYGERAAKELSRRIDRSIKELVTDQ
ncbi:MAG: UvrD-helicase domain-containing protein, partial [Proteobacteria bacterium]|nr:UvrD-helicase domain-containing protein [Pseudomonadota bacterium]